MVSITPVLGINLIDWIDSDILTATWLCFDGNYLFSVIHSVPICNIVMPDGEFIKQNVAGETDVGFHSVVIYSGNTIFKMERVNMGG